MKYIGLEVMDQLSGKVKVGKIKDAHGLKGELYFISFSGDISWLDTAEEFFLEALKGDVKVKKLQNFKPFKEGAIVRLENVVDRNASEALKGAMVYIDAQCLVASPGETIYLQEVLNFQVESPDAKKLGVITGFSSNGAQDILVIENEERKSYEVPFVDDFIVEIQFEKKKIILDFPESLMDINNE